MASWVASGCPIVQFENQSFQKIASGSWSYREEIITLFYLWDQCKLSVQASPIFFA